MWLQLQLNALVKEDMLTFYCHKFNLSNVIFTLTMTVYSMLIDFTISGWHRYIICLCLYVPCCRYTPIICKYADNLFNDKTQIILRKCPSGPRQNIAYHDDVIKWKQFPCYWPFVRGIHRSPVNYPHKAQWRGALMFSLICAWTNGSVNNVDAGVLRRHRAHYDASVM